MLINFAKSTQPGIYINTDQISFMRQTIAEEGILAAIGIIMGAPSDVCDSDEEIFCVADTYCFEFERVEDCDRAWEQLKALMDYHEIS